MKPAEFEEKEYEGPLYNQLLSGSHRIATPGQVFENAFGIDAAIEALNPVFWNFFGIHNVPSGTILNDHNWGWVWRRFGKDRRLPTYPVNLLVQAKRPDFLKGRNRNLSWFGISGSYWRFKIREHQQPLLNRLSTQLRHRAFVTYASPAFHTYAKLDEYTENMTIVENSSFVTAEKMDGHESWNYDQPGAVGVAHSEPVGYEGPDFFTELSELTSEAEPQDAVFELKEILSVVERVVKQDERNPICRRYRSYSEHLSEIGGGQSPEVDAFRRISGFFSLVGVTWMVAGKEDKRQLQD